MKRMNSTAVNQDKKKWGNQATIWFRVIARTHPPRQRWRTWLSSPLTRYIFLTATEEQRSFFSSLLLQGEVDYCCRTNPGRPLAVRKQPLSLTLLPRRSSHYCARNFNLRCLDCCWQPAATPPTLLSLCRGGPHSRPKHLAVVNKSASQTPQTSPTPARNCCVQLRDKTSFSEVRH